MARCDLNPVGARCCPLAAFRRASGAGGTAGLVRWRLGFLFPQLAFAALHFGAQEFLGGPALGLGVGGDPEE